MNKIDHRLRLRHPIRVETAILCLAAAVFFASCTRREAPSAPPTRAGTEPSSLPVQPAAPAVPDPRLRYATGQVLAGLPDRFTAVSRIKASGGRPLLAPVASVEGDMIVYALTSELRSPRADRLVVLRHAEGARPIAGEIPLAALPLALAISGEGAALRLVVALADGALCAYGPSLEQLWLRRGPAASALVALPAGRILAAFEDGSLAALDAASGEDGWISRLDARATALAYAPGMVVAAYRAGIVAFDEADGREFWRQGREGAAFALGSAGELLALLDAAGGLELRARSDGKLTARGFCRFVPLVSPIYASTALFVAPADGGLVALDPATGGLVRAYAPERTIRVASADEDRLFAVTERHCAVIDRRSGNLVAELPLVSPPWSAPLAAAGCLWLLLEDGSLVSIADSGAARLSPLGFLAPAPEIRDRIRERLAHYAREETPPEARLVRWELFVDGLPVEYPGPRFVAARLDAEKSGKFLLSVTPAKGRVLLALLAAEGDPLITNVDELGAEARLELWLEKGKRYWIVAGRLDAEEEGFRLLLR